MSIESPTVASRLAQIAEQVEGVVIIRPRVDFMSSDTDLEQGLIAAVQLLDQRGVWNVVLDFSQTAYLGTAALGAMVRLWKRVSHKGGRMALCCVSEPVQEVFQVTKLHTMWPLYESREAALRAIHG